MLRFILITYFSLLSILVNGQSCETELLDPRVRAALSDSIHDLQPQFDNRSIEQVKQDVMKQVQYYPIEDVDVLHITADSIPIYVFNASKQSNLPIILYFHPGGFVTPFLPFMKHECWKMSKDLQAIVVAVDYHIAPAYKFPNAVNDAYHSFEWLLNNGKALDGDIHRLVVAGMSAGGNLAAVVCQKAKKNGLADKVKLQVLNCPSLDNIHHQAMHTSYKTYSSGYFQTTAFITFAQQLYVDVKDYNNPEFAPILTQDLRGLPPTVMIMAEFDVLRDEEVVYAERLRQNGVRVWARCFPGQIHCLIGLPAEAKERSDINELIKTAMQEVFTK